MQAPPVIAAQTPAPAPSPQREMLSIDLKEVGKPWKGDFDGMVQRRLIRVLTVQNKTNYFVVKGVPRGATHDAFQVFEQDLNARLVRESKLKQKHLKVRVLFIPVSRDELLPALQEGKGDIAAANLTVTEERSKRVDFSRPVHANVSEVVVSAADAPALQSLDDLAGREVFVRKSSSYYESLSALNQRFAGQGKPGMRIKLMPEALEDEDLLEMVNAGLIPLTIVDRHKADFWKQVFPRIVVRHDIAVRTGGDIAWAVRKDSPQLRAVLDEFIARHGPGSQSANVILKRYLKNAEYVKNAASEAERRKFLALIDLFKKYGEKYDVDWLLMAAQGYQESGLDQKARSHVGAVGVMQIMPATGKDLKVGDIRKVESNIHAGIKYMRWMIDQYYGDEPMTRLDKALFAFASYNAGAGRISQLRKEAAQRGLNPNVWFHNVEYVAAEKIGAETVTYVSNIFKYYIAYSLIQEAREEKEKAAKALQGQVKKP
jgi:membrane-bound lytic murein transglycosylase MltF